MSSKILFPEKDKMMRDVIHFASHNYTFKELIDFIDVHINMALFIGMTKADELQHRAIDKYKHKILKELEKEKIEINEKSRKIRQALEKLKEI